MGAAPHYFHAELNLHPTDFVLPNICSQSPPGKLNQELHSLLYKQPGPVSTLIYIVVGHPQQVPLWWK